MKHHKPKTAKII